MQSHPLAMLFVLRVLVVPAGIAMFIVHLFLATLPFLIFMWLVRWLIS